ncbi:hypothetical protein RHGRI_013723 [Rhododendron griersonianum]|uniref:Alpha/beta hydrolase fold-3 domain-containing protein n=1 Tax=Rhododendron griersonianum TaxID=479676 RepID=A0AAV6K6Z7_9ERIC|nr:hypothetical protein RHGRI_013723 [Rhododendron griersonianum]
MDPNTSSEITHKFPPFFQVHKDCRVERYRVSGFAPPTLDSRTGVESKDVVISPRTGVKARIFLPKINGPDLKKLPLVIHYHGGGFCVGSALDAVTAAFLTRLVSEANVVAISVDYRLAPEHPLPTAFDDSEPDEMLRFLYPGSSGTDSDPKLSPKADPDVGKMGVDKVLVLVAEKDGLRPRGVDYCEALRNSGWKGDVELVENEGEDHVFVRTFVRKCAGDYANHLILHDAGEIHQHRTVANNSKYGHVRN